VIAVRNEHGVNASVGEMRVVGFTVNNANVVCHERQPFSQDFVNQPATLIKLFVFNQFIDHGRGVAECFTTTLVPRRRLFSKRRVAQENKRGQLACIG